MNFVLSVLLVSILDVQDVGVYVVEDKIKPIVLWQKPLIELIGDCIFIDDVLVWRNGETIGSR